MRLLVLTPKHEEKDFYSKLEEALHLQEEAEADDTENVSLDNESARLLALRYGGDESCIKDFSDENSLVDSLDNIETIVCLAHSDTKMLGDYDAKTFVQTLIQNLTHALRKKYKHESAENIQERLKQLHINLHLVSCEANMKREDGTSLATDIAQLLAVNKLVNIKVSGFSNPRGTSPAGMRVAVVTKEGFAGKIEGTEPGDIFVYWLNEKQEKLATEIKQLEKDIGKKKLLEPKLTDKNIKEHEKWRKELGQLKTSMNKKNEQLTDELKGSRHYKVVKNPKVELGKRGNRAYSSKEELQKEFDPKQSQAIEYIQRRIAHLVKYEHKNPKIPLLNELVENLYDEMGENWKSHIEVAIKEIKEQFLFISSETIDLLQAIVNDNHHDIEKVFKEQEKSKPKEKPKKEVKKKSKEEEKDEKQPLLHDQKEKPDVRNHRQQNEVVVAPAPHVDSASDIRGAIHAYLKQLREERASHCGFTFLGNYKHWKLNNLINKIASMHDPVQIKNEIIKVYDNSWLITWGLGGKHRAENLITNILQGHASKGISKPDHKLTADELKQKELKL